MRKKNEKMVKFKMLSFCQKVFSRYQCILMQMFDVSSLSIHGIRMFLKKDGSK